MADDMPSLDQMGNPTGEPVDVATPQKVGNDTAKGGNFFSQFLTGDETKYQDMSFGQRVTDTAKANWYTGTGLGTSIARMQADPAAATERALDGLTEEEKQSARATFADWQASELAKLKTAENPVNVTDAQIAVIQNKLHPSASGAGDVAADVIGALGGGLASPEMLVLPSSGAAKGLAAAAPVTARFLEGMAGRMLDTGVSMAVLNTGMNPVIQKQSVEAGLQPEFDYMRLGLAPLEGFIGGALLHGAMEGAGRGIGYATSEIRRGFQQRVWQRITDPLKEDPAFRAPGDVAPVVEPEKIGTLNQPSAETNVPSEVNGQSRPMSANDGQQSAATFQTAKGSTYEVHQDGTTTRTKAARDDVGHEGDFGEKPRTEKTVYIDPADAERLATPQGKWRFIDHGDGTVSLATQNADGKWGISPSARNVPVSTTPEVGKTPLELWKQESVNGLPGYGKAHFGNEIVSVEAAPEVKRQDASVPANIGTATPQARMASQPALGPQSEDGVASKFMREFPPAIDMMQRGELTVEKAYEMRDKAANLDRQIVDEIFGPRADEFRRLERKSNGTSKGADEAQAKLDDMIGELPQAQQDMLYGRGWHDEMTKDFWSDLANKIDYEGFSKEDVAKMLNVGLRDLPDTRVWDDMRQSEKLAVLQTHFALQELERLGVPEKDALRMAAQRAGQLDGADAAELFKTKLERFKQIREEGVVAPASNSPASKEDGPGRGAPIDETPSARIENRPSLQNEPTSWVIRNKETGETIMETYDRAKVDALNADKYEAVPSLQHMQEFAAAVKDAGGIQPKPGWNKKGTTPREPGRPADTPELQFRKRTGNSPNQPTVAGTGQPPVDQIKSLQQQTFDLADAIGIPLRQGRLASGDAMGQYNSKYGVARVRDVGDFYVAAHEGGHAVEQKIGPELTAAIGKHANELGPLDYDTTRGSPAEGFAEWFATSLTNPAYAKNQAPGFAQEFRNIVGQKNPELLAKLDAAAQGYAAYEQASSGMRVAANVVQKGETGWFAETKDFLKEEGFPATIGKVLADAYGAFFDDKAPVARTVRNLARLFRENNKGELLDLKGADNPETLLRLFARAQQGAIYQMRYGVVPYHDVTPVGASLHDAIATATGASPVLGRWQGASVDDFSTYLVAKRASVLWDRKVAGELEFPPVAFSKIDADAAIAELGTANPGFERGAQMVHEYTRNMLAKQRDAGLITQDLFDTLSKDPFYVPLFRDVSDKPLAGKTGGGSSNDGPGMTDTIKRLRGSSRDIIDPIQGIMMQTFLAERTIRHNDIIKAFADLAERVGPGAGAFVEPVKAKELRGSAFDLGEAIKSTARQRGLDPNDTALLMNSVTNAFGDDPIMGTMFKMQPASKKGEPIMFYKQAGELKAVRFTGGREGEKVYEILTALPQPMRDIWHQMLSVSASALRLGATAHPTFIITNYIRDQMAIGILRPDYIPFISGMRGLKSELTQDKAAQLYAYFGGVSPGASVTDVRGMMDANVHSIAAKGYVASRVNTSSAKEFATGLIEAMQVTEAASRNSVFGKVYDQKIAQGLSPYEAAIEAAYQGTDILDFGRHGSRTEALRGLIPFLNAHLQGVDLGRRTILEPLARAARGDLLTTKEQAQTKNALGALFKVIAVGPALGFTYAALMWDREEYRDASQEMKATHVVIPWGHKVITLPKPFELSLGFTWGEQAFAWFMKKDPRAAMNMVKSAFEVLAPPSPLNNPAIKTAFEVGLNRSWFTGRDIEPQSLQALDPAHRYTEKTSTLAKQLGKLTGLSPIKIDYTVGSLFSLWGKDIQSASNWFAGEDDKPESLLEDAVFLRRFIKDPDRSGETTKRYYEFAASKTGEFAQATETFQRYMGNFKDKRAQDWFNTLTDEKKAYVTLQAGADEESGKRKFTPDDRRLHPLTRAQSALTALHSVTRELTENSQINTENGERLTLTPTQRRDAIEAVHQLGAQEMRNALVILNDNGYKGRAVLDTEKQFAILKAISPEVADEIARRYATQKVLPTVNIAEVWPMARKRLLQDGSEADISDLTSDASAAGYEFGGERTKRRERRRGPIKGMSQQATDGD